MDSYDKFLADCCPYNREYIGVKDVDQKEVNDYLNILLYNEEYVNSVSVYTNLWETEERGLKCSYIVSYGSHVVNGTKYYFCISVGD